MDDKVIIVSCDSHAGVPKDRWVDYLPEKYHDLLPQLRRDNEIYPMAVYLIVAKRAEEGLTSTCAQRDDWHGLYDPRPAPRRHGP